MMPIINKISSLDNKDYYIYMPGTTHYDEDRFGNPIYVKDYYYLDEKFNKFIMQCDKSNVEEFVTKLKETGRNVVVGEHAPLKETRHGDFVLYTNPNIKGIWERPTKEQLLNYKKILEEQEIKNVKKLA